MEAVHVDPEYYSTIFKIFQKKDTDTEINKEWLKENIMGLVDQCVRENEAPGPLKVLSLGCGAASGHISVLEKFKGHLVMGDGFEYIFSDDIARALETLELPYQKYPLISRCDITEVFTDTEEGQMLLDFLTGVINFRNTAPPELVTKFCDELTKISFKKDGRLFINNTSDAFTIKKPFE